MDAGARAAGNAAAGLVAGGAREEIELRISLSAVGIGELSYPIAGAPDNVFLKIFPDVEETKPHVAHQPLVGAAAGAVDAHRTHVDGDCAGTLDDIGVHQRAARVFADAISWA